MLKKLVMFFMMICFLGTMTAYAKKNISPSHGKKVLNVRIIGNKKVKKSRIKTHISLRRKKIFSQKKVDNDIRKILETGDFDDVEVSVQESPAGVTVIYKVKEKPRVSGIVIKGNHNIKTRKVKKTIKSKENKAFDATKVWTDREEIIKLYKEKGYAGTVIF